MKRLRRSQAAWYVPPPPPAVAVFACRGCRAPLTGPLRLVDDPTTLGVKDLTPLVPPGRYWPVARRRPRNFFGGEVTSDIPVSLVNSPQARTRSASRRDGRTTG